MTRSNNFRNMQTSSSRIPMMVAVVLGMLMTLYPNTASSFSSHSALPSTPTRCHSNQQFSPRFSYQLLAEFESGGSSSSSELELEIAEEAEQDSVEADEDEEMEEMTPVEANEKQVDDKENETEEEFVLPPSSTYFWSMEENQESSLSTAEALTLDQEQLLKDESFMRMAIDMAGEERGPNSAYPNPSVGAVLVADDGRILAKGKSSYAKDAIRDVLENAGLTATPLREWCITWPASMKFRNDLAAATLYVTLEPDAERRGQALPPLTQLIELSGISRIVIGAASPIPEQATNGAQALHQAGLDVTMGLVLVDECQSLIQLYTDRVLSKLQCMARKHRQYFNRPLGFLHCSVVDSSDLEAFAQHGNAFGKSFGGQILSERNFGSYEFAPPPEQIWADDEGNDFNELDFLANMEFDEDEEEAMLSLDFEEENPQERLDGVSMMPWYEQVDAVIATFPHAGNNGPTEENDTVMSRLNGLKWLATYGNDLPPGVERILVMDATDLDDLPLSNSDPNLPPGVDVEAFWMAARRRPSRVLLRKGKSTQAEAAAKAAAAAAKAAAKAAEAAKEAIETGEAELAAEAAMEYQAAALASTELIQMELSKMMEQKQKLQDFGVVVETLDGEEPIHVMKHIGARSGYDSVVWRAGCWGQKGVKSILDGAFQWVSAHLAVDATGGKFWQQMLAERAVQGACGPESRVKVFASEGDISLEYCDSPDADSDCVLSVDGRPVRHVRLDCRVALVDSSRPREFVIAPTKRLDRKVIEEEAPWFL